MQLASEVVESALDVSRAARLAVELPVGFGEYTVFVDVLRRCGGLGWLSEVVLKRRAGAFELIDLVMFLGAYFASSKRGESIAEFARASAEYGNELAAIGDRRRWPSQASVSRALGSVGEDACLATAQKLLDISSAFAFDSKVCGACTDLDGNGEPWRVLHWDTTVKALRKRGLPSTEDLPEPIRLSDQLAEPGYTGRGRGETNFFKSIVYDATSGAWVHVDLTAGGGAEQMARAVKASVDFVSHVPEQLERTVMICDGIAGGVPQSKALVQAGMHVVTRSSGYTQLKGDDASRLLETSTWLPVTDSKSGPNREAIDLGVRIIRGQKLRVIVSRFVHGGTTRGAGHNIGAWRYELFFTSLPASSWAANDIVTLYFGRTAIENRFTAENLELDLTRVFRFSQSGQLLASAVAMALWNLRIALGLHSISQTVAPRTCTARPAIANLKQAVEAVEAVEAAHSAPQTTDEEETAPQPADLSDGAETALSATEQALRSFCSKEPNWRHKWETLICPANLEITPSSRVAKGRHITQFRAPAACWKCPQLSLCARGNVAEKFRKEVNIPVAFTPSKQASTPHHYVITGAQPSIPPLQPKPPTLNSAVLRRLAVSH